MGSFTVPVRLGEACIVIGLLLATFLEKGLTQEGTSTCYNTRIFGCRPPIINTEVAPSGPECCSRGFLAYNPFGTDQCILCTDNAFCYSGTGLTCESVTDSIEIGSIHDCCLLNPEGSRYLDEAGNCQQCATGNFFCLTRANCMGNIIAELSGPPTKSSINSCCEGQGEAYAINGRCFPCVVFGWTGDSFEGPESASDTLTLGYIKGMDGAVNVSITVGANDTASAEDISLSMSTETVAAGSTTNVSVTFIEDGLALEDTVENGTLQLVLSERSFPNAPGAIIRRNFRLSIMDTDEVVINFAEASFTGSEREGNINVTLTKSSRIAVPVTIQLQSFTVARAESTGQPLPTGVPPTDQFSPNRASDSPEERRDFSTDPIVVTFQADEFGEEVGELTVSVPIENDNIDEAPLEVFVIVLTVTDPTSGVRSTQPSTLARIEDDDDIRIGFQQAVYSIPEESVNGALNQVLLAKENDQITEQTFFVLLNVSADSLNPATEGEDYVNSGNPFILTFFPGVQTVTLPVDMLRLLNDNLPELIEGLTIVSSSANNPGVPVFLPPTTLFATTQLVIVDNDPLQVGFVSSYSVEENVGMFNACVRVLNVEDSQPLPFTIPLLVNSVPGAANEVDYMPVGPNVSLLLNNERREDCLPVQINDDVEFEQDETFMLTLELDRSRPYTMRDVADMFLNTEVTILANDDMCPNLDPPANGLVSFNPDTTDRGFSDVGAVATFSCNERFALVGTATRICQTGTLWSGVSPTCESIVCSELLGIENGMISYDPDGEGSEYSLGTVASYSCDMGFALVGDENRTCVDVSNGITGEFDGTVPTCQLIMCSELPPIDNGAILYDPDNVGPNYDFGTVATYSCNMGFTLVGVINRTCEDTSTGPEGEFSGVAPICQPIICNELPAIGNGTISYTPDDEGPEYDVGTVAIYSCNLGFALVGDSSRVCEDVSNGPAGEFSGAPPTCQAIVCGELQAIDNGVISYAPDSEGPEYNVGTVATYNCDMGFALVGDSSRVCEDVSNGPVGEFSGAPPTCQAIVCDELPAIDDGMITYNPDSIGPVYDLGTVATYTCDEGFMLVGSARRTCVNGNFSGNEPICSLIPVCQDLPPLMNGQIIYSTDVSPRAVGTVATHSCNEGFVLMGVVNRTCEESTRFSGSQPICEPVCQDLPPLMNGQIIYSPDISPRAVGTVATHSCNEGFILMGVVNRTCEESRQFSGSQPICESLCRDLLPLLNGAISYTPDTGGPFRDIGTIATHSCDAGFILEGARMRECIQGGMFSGAAPSCQAEPRCPVLPVPPNGLIEYTPNVLPPRVGTVATYSCGSGFQLTGGTATRVCQNDMTFSGNEPFCQQVGRRVNDTATGDPVMTVPLYITNSTNLPQIGENNILNLCFEVHGEQGRYFNLVSDSCVTVNAHYAQAHTQLGFNIISEVTILAPDLTPLCHNISVSASGCRASIDGTVLNSTYSSAGISVRLYHNRVRIAVPNCQNLDLVMWVFCEAGAFSGDPDFSEPDITVTVPAIRFVIARGFNIRESAHGILGQFWNVPIEVERYTGQLSDGSIRDNTYIITVRYPNQPARQFLSSFDSPIWDANSGGYCLYAGNSQGGPISELLSPNDPVIEGWYTDYIVTGAFEFQFLYSHFDPLECGG